MLDRAGNARPQSSPWALNVGGLMNVQYAIKDGDIYVLEVNPRASRTVPFVAKTVGAPIAKIAARVMAGENSNRPSYGRAPNTQAQPHRRQGSRLPVCPVPRRRHAARAGNALHRRGHGARHDFAMAFAKASLAPAKCRCSAPSLFRARRDKPRALDAISSLVDLGFKHHGHRRHRNVISPTRASPASASTRCWKAARTSSMRSERQGPAGASTPPRAPRRMEDSKSLRRAALMQKVPYFTTTVAGGPLKSLLRANGNE
jgi:carbamoyl-phosphate synthase large subunit